MRLILHRYIFFELLKVFILSTAAITLFLALANALTELRDRGLGPIDSAHLVLYFVPAMLVFAMPVAALLTTTLVYGRLASDNEITACRASGVSMSTLLWPVLVLGLLIALATFSLHDHVIPWARYRAEDVGKQSIERFFFHRMRTRRHVSFGGLFISAKHIQGNILYGVVVRYREGGRNVVAYAPAARIDFLPVDASPAAPADRPADVGTAEDEAKGPTRAEVAATCDDARVVRYGRVSIFLYRFYAFDEGQARKSSITRGDQGFTWSLDTVRVMEPEEMTLAQLAARYKMPETTFDYRWASSRTWSEDSLVKLKRRIKAYSLAEMHGRYASIASCVLLVALGAALGTVFRHGHILTAFFVSMGPALFAIFSVLLGVKMVRAEPQYMHSLVSVIWVGNAVVLVIDALLVGQLLRR